MRSLKSIAILAVCGIALYLMPSAHGHVFDIQFSESSHAGPITGRAYLIVTRDATPEPRLTIGWEDQPPVFAVDLDQLQPGSDARIDSGTLGYPIERLGDIP